MKATEILLEAAKKRYPKSSDETINRQALAVFGKEAVKNALKAQGFSESEKIAGMALAITLGELEETVKNYPSLTKVQILRFFRKEAMADEKVRIDSAYITRPALITLVERLEEYTGLRMTDDTDAPLAYLDRQDPTLTIGDIADFFSENPESKIRKMVLDRVCPQDSPKMKALFRDAVKQFLKECIKGEVDETAPITSLKPDFSCGDKDYYVVVHWVEGRFRKAVSNKFVETKTIGELIDFFATK